MAYLHRCSRCGKRRALKRLMKDYIRPPACAACGNRRYNHDLNQERRNALAVCRCEGYHFTHRRGSKWCEHAHSTVLAQEAVERFGGDELDHHWDCDPRIIGYGVNNIEAI